MFICTIFTQGSRNSRRARDMSFSGALVPSIVSQGQPQAVSSVGATHTAFPEVNRIRDLAEQIRQRCAHVHLSQQASSFQVSQAEELTKRLKDVVEKLQEAVKDFSLADVQEQLGLIASRLNLKFETQQSAQTQACSFFIISDAYYTEVCCQGNGYVASVKLVQASLQEDSEVLTQLLRAHEFSKFEHHLQAITDFYKQASSPNDYPNMYRVLTAIEKEVVAICDKSPQVALNEMIMSNPLGHVTPRKGGHPQYLTIFVHPYEVLKNPFLSKPPVGGAKTRQEIDLGLGVALKMLMEKNHQVNRLSIVPNLFNFSQAAFFQLTEQNSVLLSLNFTLELSKPVPACGIVLDRLHDAVYAKVKTEQRRVKPTGCHINQLVAMSKASKEGKDTFSENCRIVCLPGQRHYYFMPAELKSGDVSCDLYPSSVCGTMLPKVVFCHPVQLFSIIPLLQKQLMYNTLLDSCLGRSTKGIPPSVEGSEFIFEISTMPPDQVTVTMDTQSTNEDDRMIVEFLVPDQQPTKISVQVKVGTSGIPMENPQLSTITRRCLSIPVSLHAALKHPSQLLGSKGAAALQAYNRSILEFNKELGTVSKSKTVSHIMTEEVLETPYLGMKRKRTD